MSQFKSKNGFTLVELLVVIGIIALLISILLPALNAARRQAGQVKCAAQMKQLHNAFLLYAIDNHNYWPPVSLQTAAATAYNYELNGTVFTNVQRPYFFDFVARYVTKVAQGGYATNAADAAASKRTVIWGCPAWDGYYRSTANANAKDAVNPVDTGFGMNQWPTFSSDLTTANGKLDMNGIPPTDGNGAPTTFTIQSNIGSFNGGAGFPQYGKFYPATTWGRQGANRLLIADSRFYFVESQTAPLDKTFPGQPINSSAVVYTASSNPTVPGACQTMVDVYRHGKTPGGVAANTFPAVGGKVAYNILYCDGHVAGCNDQRPAYESVRQRYPG